MDKIDKILIQTLSKRKFAGPAIAAMVCFWAKGWGKSRFEPISFSRGILKVSVRSSSASSELQMQEGELVEYLNKKAGKRLVLRVRIMNYS